MPFPTTSLLDTFARADESPLASPWAQLDPSYTGPLVLTNFGVTGGGAASDYASYLNTLQYADSEVYILGDDQTSGSLIIFTRLQNVGAGTLDGYAFGVSGSVGIFGRFDNSSPIPVANVSIGSAFSPNDMVGGRSFGSKHQLWIYRAATGLWTRVLEVTDANYPGAGFVGIQMRGGGTNHARNFGGGAYNLQNDQGDVTTGSTNTRMAGRGIS